MSSKLPLEVLSQAGPILCWIEGAEGLRFPETWQTSGLPFETREQAWLLHELPTYSYDNVDEVVSLARASSRAGGRHRLLPHEQAQGWRLSPPAGYDLAKAFGKLGERYFAWSGSELSVREGKMEELHELALRFPVVHLVRRLHAEAVVRGSLPTERALELPEQPSQLHTASHGLRTVVHRGISEGHLHLWGVTSASEVWADHLLQPLVPGYGAKFRPEDFRLLRLSRAGVSLLALVVLLARLPGEDRKLPFGLLDRLDSLYQARTRTEEWTARRELRKAFHEAWHDEAFLTAVGGVEPAEDWLVRLINPTIHRLRVNLRYARWERRRPPRREGLRERVRLLERLHFEVQRLLMTLPVGPDSRSRELLHEVFFRYLVYQTHHWQLATQSGKTTGLRQFQRYFFSQQRRTLAQVAADEQALIFERLCKAASLRAVEGRVRPPRAATELVPWILGYADGAAKRQLDSFGLVVHFLKADRGKTDRPAPSQRAFNLSVRYGRIRRQTRETALRLYRFLSEPHPVVPFIVGIDAANLELPTPPEVFAPAFRFLRELPIEMRPRRRISELSALDHELDSLLASRHLRMTYHVGEEFRHLLTGLRAIAEVIEFLGPRPGDRLGHAIALALDPKVWAKQMGYQAVLSRQEWLDTLVWVHHFLGPGHDLVGTLAVEDQIQQLSRQIYSTRDDDRDWPLPSLYDAWTLRQLDPYCVDLEHPTQGKYKIRDAGRQGAQFRRWSDIQSAALKRVNRHVGSNAAYQLLNRYWYNSTVRREGDKRLTIEMQEEKHAWLSLCREVQEKMKREVQKRELVVEVNPSSNRLVGPLSEMAEHHIFRLTFDEKNPLAHDLWITVNTDDPGVFNTSLAHEYYLLGETLMNKGYAETEVVEWLDWLRQNGNDSTFLRSLPEASDPRIQALFERVKSGPRYRFLRDRLECKNPYESFWEALKRGRPQPDDREGDTR